MPEDVIQMRESALRQILDVISRSRDDEIPVFNAILDNALRLCDAPFGGVFLYNGERTHFRPVAWQGSRSNWLETFRDNPPPADASKSMMEQAAVERMPVQVYDVKDTDLYRRGEASRVAVVELEGMRTAVTVPMFSGEECVGVICLYRRVVQGFDESQIELVKTFAAQAVIAIENVHQFRELQTRLEREAATREVLQVISRSRADEEPVFDVILRKALDLCDADTCLLNLVDVNASRAVLVACQGRGIESFKMGVDAWPLDSPQPPFLAIRNNRIYHTKDIRDTDLYRAGDPTRRRIVDRDGMRTQLVLPLVSDNEAIGSFVLLRQRVQLFGQDEIGLLETFAEQAAIAIENVRQFKALQARTEEVQTLNENLEVRVKAQVGEIERMGRLKRFLPAAVADTVISRGSDNLLSSHRALLGVLFCDIRGFTAFCETAEPEETIEVLQTYHEEMGKLIADHGAGVDHRMGDGIMVLFNDPLPCEDPAGDAVRLAVAMRAQMVEICRKWKRFGYRLGFGVGVSLGYATVGMVGYEGRYDYTASGTAVNLAARLSDLAEDGEILLSPRAFTAVEDNFAAEPQGEVSLKGIREPVQVYCLLDKAN